MRIHERYTDDDLEKHYQMISTGEKDTAMNRKPKHGKQQANMFAETQADLPLFSGTPQRVYAPTFNPRPVEKQFSMFAPMTTQPANQQKEG